MRKGSCSEELVKIVVPKTAQLSEPNSIDNSSIQKTTSYSETSSHPRRCAVTHSTARIPRRCSPGIEGMPRRSPWTARLIKVLFDFSEYQPQQDPSHHPPSQSLDAPLS